MQNFKIALILFFALLLFKANAQTLTSSGNHTVKGKWIFENDITVKGGKSFLTDGLQGLIIKNDQLGAALTVGIAEGKNHYLPGNKPGDITIRRSGGPSKRLIITNACTLSHPNNVDAVTGMMGATKGGGVWVHNNGFVRVGNYKVEMPEEQLEVDGNIKFGYSTEGRALIWESTKESPGLKGFGHKIYNSGPGYGTLLNIAGRHNSKSWTDIIKITSNGLVGIGLTGKPTVALDVNGTIRANEIKVTKAPGADFVFDADYSLRTLDEVEDFISKNSHLPEIPSALDMETNGVELTKMNQLLLMKIEELTLYTIELNKRINELEQNK